jgi:hypothetical protein
MGEGAEDARAWRVLETAEMLARGLPSALVRARRHASRGRPCMPGASLTV